MTTSGDFARAILFSSLHHRNPVHDELDKPLDLPSAITAFAAVVDDKSSYSHEGIAAVLLYVGTRLQLYKDTGLDAVLEALAVHVAKQKVVNILKQGGAKEVVESAPPHFTLVENTVVVGDRSVTKREVTVGKTPDEPEQLDNTSMWAMVLALLEKVGGKVTFTEAEIMEVNTQKVLRTERTQEGDIIVEAVDKPAKEES